MDLPEDDPWTDEYEDALDYLTDTDEPRVSVIKPVLIFVLVGTIVAVALGFLLWGPS